MAVSVAELLADLGTETAVFDRWIATLPDAAWAQPTPAEGWTIADQVSHLAYFDDAAVLSATDPDAFRAGLDAVAGDVDGFTAVSPPSTGRSRPTNCGPGSVERGRTSAPHMPRSIPELACRGTGPT